MARILPAILFFAAITAAATESITVHGQADLEVINSIYQAFGGSWDLSLSGVAGFENASIGGFFFDTDMASIFPDRSWPITDQYTTNSSLSSSVLRRETGYGISNPSCNSDTNAYDLFTIDQQKWLTGKLCQGISNITPTTFALFGLFASNVVCTRVRHGGIQIGCSVVATIAAERSGTYLTPAWSASCYADYAAIQDKCGNLGGAVTTTDVGGDYIADVWATEKPNPVQADTCRTSDSKCSNIVCSDNTICSKAP